MRNAATLLACAMVAAFAVSSPQSPAQSEAGPPNAAATATYGDGRLALLYDGRSLLNGQVSSQGAQIEYRSLVTGGPDEAVTQVLKWTARGDGRLTLDATITGSAEAFPVEVDRPTDVRPIVRYSIGLSHSLLNRGVFDRGRDWAVSVDAPAAVTITPAATSDQAIAFHLQASGTEIALRFRPHYYQRHRGLTHFQPWTYAVWQPSVAGWTSWFAFRDMVTEGDIARTAAILAETLAPYGFEYLQIDDGFQRTPIGAPESWLRTNDKFPSGLAGLRATIAGRGFKPGLWTNTSFADREFAVAHPQYFVRAPDGTPASGHWVGFVMDGSNPATLADLVRPVYRALKQMGWQYFKVDALRHLRYEGYNSFAEYFAGRQLDRVAVYRAFAKAIHDEIGTGCFKLACWGVRPELIGLFDGCRVGSDGFGYGGFSEYNSFNNVVWRNDPDHIELTQNDAYRATTLTSLTGSVLMLTDKPEVYRTPRVEAARRTAPVVFTRPGQIYDVDPSRSDALARVDNEVSGSGPRPFDATRRLNTHYVYVVDVNRPFENWSVVARTEDTGEPVRFADLGIAPDRAQYVFEFWTKRLVGAFTGSFAPGPIDPRFGVQVLCVRPRVAHPQLLTTNRHVTCGAYDLADVGWEAGTLRGESELVANDTYELYLTEPAGYRVRDASATGAEVVSTRRSGALRVVSLRARRSGHASWRIRWQVVVPAPRLLRKGVEGGRSTPKG